MSWKKWFSVTAITVVCWIAIFMLISAVTQAQSAEVISSTTTDGVAGCGTDDGNGGPVRRDITDGFCAVEFEVTNNTGSAATVYLNASPYLGNSHVTYTYGVEDVNVWPTPTPGMVGAGTPTPTPGPRATPTRESQPANHFVGLSRCNSASTGDGDSDCEVEVPANGTHRYTVFVQVKYLVAASSNEYIKVRHKTGATRADSDPTLRKWSITATNNAYVAPTPTPSPTPTPVLTASHAKIYTASSAQWDQWNANWDNGGAAAYEAFWDDFDAKIVANGDAPYQICYPAQKNVTIYGWKFKPNYDKDNWGNDFNNLEGLTGAPLEEEAVVDYDEECFQVNG